MVLYPTLFRKTLFFCYIIFSFLLVSWWVFFPKTIVFLFLDKPLISLFYFGISFWPAAFYFLYLFLKSFPFFSTPDPFSSVWMKHKVYSGYKGKLVAASWLLFSAVLFFIPIELCFMYFYLANVLSELK